MEALAINTTVWSPDSKRMNHECVHRVLVRLLGCGVVRISLVENDTVEYCFFSGIFKLEQGGGLDCWSTWSLALDNVKQPKESCNIVASTGEWLVYISNGVFISAVYIFVYKIIPNET